MAVPGDGDWRSAFDVGRPVLGVHPAGPLQELDEVVELLLDEESQNLAELEQFIGKPIKLQAESTYTQEQYDVVLI
jgi:Ribonuclease G/E